MNPDILFWLALFSVPAFIGAVWLSALVISCIAHRELGVQARVERGISDAKDAVLITFAMLGVGAILYLVGGLAYLLFTGQADWGDVWPPGGRGCPGCW